MIEKPIISAEEAAALVKDGMVIMAGGFMGCGVADAIVGALKARELKGATLISNDTSFHDFKTGFINGVGPLVQAHGFDRIITSHIGLNQETQRQMNLGETVVDLTPQGTLAEQVRAGGAGLGGFLTPTGIGTEAADGKQVITVEGKTFLLELPLRAEVALLKAKRADKAGNLIYAGTARNFNPLMATAAEVVIAEVEEIVEIGEIDPNDVHTSSIFVDFLVRAERLDMWEK